MDPSGPPGQQQMVQIPPELLQKLMSILPDPSLTKAAPQDPSTNTDSIIRQAYERNILPMYATKSEGMYGDKSGHVVEPGETWESLAGRFGVPVDELVIANPHVSPLALQAGVFILIPRRYSFTDFVEGVIHPDTNMQLWDPSGFEDGGDAGGGSSPGWWSSLWGITRNPKQSFKSAVKWAGNQLYDMRRGVNSWQKAGALAVPLAMAGYNYWSDRGDPELVGPNLMAASRVFSANMNEDPYSAGMNALGSAIGGGMQLAGGGITDFGGYPQGARIASLGRDIQSFALDPRVVYGTKAVADMSRAYARAAPGQGMRAMYNAAAGNALDFGLMHGMQRVRPYLSSLSSSAGLDRLANYKYMPGFVPYFARSAAENTIRGVGSKIGRTALGIRPDTSLKPQNYNFIQSQLDAMNRAYLWDQYNNPENTMESIDDLWNYYGPLGSVVRRPDGAARVETGDRKWIKHVIENAMYTDKITDIVTTATPPNGRDGKLEISFQIADYNAEIGRSRVFTISDAMIPKAEKFTPMFSTVAANKKAVRC
eukprot:jgi/Mesvir1/21976/Mv04512-RA.1